LVLADSIDADFHQHSFVQVTLSLQFESEFEIEIGAGSFRCAGIAIDSNVRHRLDGAGRPLLLLFMDGTSDLAASFKNRIGGRGFYEFPADTQEVIASFVLEQYPSIVDSASYGRFLTRLLQLLGVEYVQPAIADERIREVIHLLKDCKGAEHSIGLYAEQTGLSNSRLSHLFKENTGISLSGYLLLHKLQKAVYLIFNGASITEAALSAGFDSPSHFAAASKKLLGMTAKEIRKDSVFLKVSCLL